MLCFYDLAAEGTLSLAGTSLSITQDRFSKILMVGDHPWDCGRLDPDVRIGSVREPGLRQLIDLQIILARKPEMRPAVLVAYATASAEGKHHIESIVQEADPSFLIRLQKKAP